VKFFSYTIAHYPIIHSTHSLTSLAVWFWSRFSVRKWHNGQSASIADNDQTMLLWQQLLTHISANDNQMTDTRLTDSRAADCYKHGDCMLHWTLDGDKALINGRHPAVLSKLLHQPLRVTMNSRLLWRRQFPSKLSITVFGTRTSSREISGILPGRLKVCYENVLCKFTVDIDIDR